MLLKSNQIELFHLTLFNFFNFLRKFLAEIDSRNRLQLCEKEFNLSRRKVRADIFSLLRFNVEKNERANIGSSPLGDNNLTPWGQSSPLGANFSPWVKFRHKG
jgi:hypothetical protein